MSKIDLINQLQERNLLSQVTNKESLIKEIKSGLITLYCGFDPTSDSLHLGHLILLLCLRRFQKAGHKPIVLVGGATGLIGDPSFKSLERQLNNEEIVKKQTETILKQITFFLDFNCGVSSAVIVNNYDWFSNMNMLTFLRDIGKHFSVNSLIKKEAVKHRLDREAQGISFTEFSYNLLQAYDFTYLHKYYNVTLQIGGSDQWGNITSGIDLIHRLYKKQVFGLTVPLVTKYDGTKFGKTESNTIWLDPKKTSPYKLYQFLVNTADSDVYRFLKFFTFMKVKEINYLEEEDKKKSKESAQRAQFLLAKIVTKMVHGEKGLKEANRITKNLFRKNIKDLNESDFKQLIQDGIVTIKAEKKSCLAQALVDSKVQSSYGQARKAIISNAISINGKKQNNPKYVFTDSDRLFGKYTLLRFGKKSHCILCWKN